MDNTPQPPDKRDEDPFADFQENLLLMTEREKEALLTQKPEMEASGDPDVTGRLQRMRVDAVVGDESASMTLHSPAPPEVFGSPMKKVQFEVGDDGEDDDTDRGDQENLNLRGQEGTNRIPVPVTPGSAARDFMMTATSSCALPVIAEESRNGQPTVHSSSSPQFAYSRSASMIVDIPPGAGTGTPGGGGPDSFIQQEKSEVYNFVQLNVLDGDGDFGNREWKEIARWIKYEEALEEGSGRWGRPHVASLSFSSMTTLRALIGDGVLLMDLPEKDMAGVGYRVSEKLTAKGHIRHEDASLIMRIIGLRHRPVQEPPKSWFGLKRNANSASSASLQSLFDDKNRAKGVIADPSFLVRRNSGLYKNIQEMTSSVRNLSRSASNNFLKTPADPINGEAAKPLTSQSENENDGSSEMKWLQRKESSRKLLLTSGGTEGEATVVLVANIDFLKKSIFVFGRLRESTIMSIVEIPVPVRCFAFFLVPSNVDMDIVEIGRSFGALMSNRSFYEAALFALTRKHLMEGINEFLDDSIVLPPGDWDNHDLLPLHVLQAKSKAIQLRKIRKQHSFIARSDSMYEGLTMGSNVDADDFDKAFKEKREENPFERTGRPFGGLIRDVKRRFPFYKSDFQDGCNFQCFSTITFMYFASIGLVITFAGLMSEKTNNLIGTSETIIMTGAAGVFFSLFAAQPLIPIGPTGPLLVFDEILYNFCQRNEIEFLPMRAWISVWLLVIILIVGATEGNVLVRHFSRFTQDIFSVLTSLLLIWESASNLVEVFQAHPLRNAPHYIPTENGNETMKQMNVEDETMDVDDIHAQPNTALLSTILMLGTFFLGYFLKEFRNSVFFVEKARRALGDFSVPIAILTMVLLDYVVTDTYTQKIRVPMGFESSSPDKRNWFISPMGVNGDFPYLYCFAAVLPATLIFILMFMSMQICELIVNRKERRLIKGSGFHLDIVLVGFINLACGFFGAPWLCCAALRAVAHVSALTVYSENNPPGEKPSIIQVLEQRVTNLAVSTLIALSMLLSPFLAFTPMAVLFGVFLYMGISSMSTTQLFERFMLFFIPSENHPQTPYVRRVKTWKMHMFTLIQIGCLGILWTVKSWKLISLAFPFFLVLLVPVRLYLKKYYNEKELEALDGDPVKSK